MQPTQIASTIGTRAPIFWSRVDRSGGDGACWPWMSGKQSGGYGRFSVAPGAQESSHRIALAIALNGGPDGAHALHSCDNPSCCNPAHLRWGTAAENALDKMHRGRAKAGRTNETTCGRGHQMTTGNTLIKQRPGRHGRVYTTKTCRQCQNDAQKLRRTGKAA